VVGPRLAGRDHEPVAVAAGRGDGGARGEERRSGPLDGRPTAGIDPPGTHRPAHRQGVIVEAAEEDGPERVGVRHEEPLDLVALGHAERGEPLGRRDRPLEIGPQGPQPGTCQLGRPARVDDVAEEHDPPSLAVHAGRLPAMQIAVNS